MSKYTTEVRYICENYAGLNSSIGYNGIENVITGAIPKIFDFAYPIFDEAYREVIERKILKHYYTREIGAETVGLWKHWLSVKMNEIMPYYNKLYKSELLSFNPLYTVDMTVERSLTKEGTKVEQGSSNLESNISGSGSETRVGTENREGAETTNVTETRAGTEKRTGSDNVTTSNDFEQCYSDTPQGGVDGLKSNQYLTNATIEKGSGSNKKTSSDDLTVAGNVSVLNEGSNTGTTNINDEKSTTNNTNTVASNTAVSNSTINDVESYLESVRGKNAGASYSKLLEEYRATFLNIDMLVINELSDLFMNLW